MGTNLAFQGWMSQPSRRKKVPRAGKRVRDTCHMNTQLHNHNVYLEDLIQTYAWFMIM